MNEDDLLFSFSDITSTNFDNLCRVCLQDGIVKSVFAEDEVPKLYQKINDCASVQIEQGDGLPEYICDYCITELNLAYNFRLQCQVSETTLQRLVKRIESLRKLKENTDKNDNVEIKEVIIPESKKPAPEVPEDTIPTPEEDKVLVLEEINLTAPEETNLKAPENRAPEVDINITKEIENETNVSDAIIPEVKIKTKVNKRSVKSKSSKLVRRKSNVSKKENIETNGNKNKLIDENTIKRNFVKKENPIEGGHKLQCQQCNKKFIFLSRLRQHELSHATDKPHRCKVCQRSFARKDVLVSHETTHLKLQPFECELCNTKFTRRNSLKKHLIIHTNRKRYKCTQCKKSFGRHDNLLVHLKTHKGTKSFKCDICMKSFIRSDVLLRHKKTHESVERHVCKICNKSYCRADVLQLHLKVHVKPEGEGI